MNWTKVEGGAHINLDKYRKLEIKSVDGKWIIIAIPDDNTRYTMVEKFETFELAQSKLDKLIEVNKNA